MASRAAPRTGTGSSRASTAARTSSPWTGPAGTESPRPRDLAGNAGAALAALDRRSVERAVVVGHSLGAAVAAWLAATRPDRVAALGARRPGGQPGRAVYARPLAGGAARRRAWPPARSWAGWALALAIGPVRRRIARATRLDEGYLRSRARAAAVHRLGAPTPPSSERWCATSPSSSAGWIRSVRRRRSSPAPHDRVVPARALPAAEPADPRGTPAASAPRRDISCPSATPGSWWRRSWRRWAADGSHLPSARMPMRSPAATRGVAIIVGACALLARRASAGAGGAARRRPHGAGHRPRLLRAAIAPRPGDRLHPHLERATPPGRSCAR